MSQPPVSNMTRCATINYQTNQMQQQRLEVGQQNEPNVHPQACELRIPWLLARQNGIIKLGKSHNPEKMHGKLKRMWIRHTWCGTLHSHHAPLKQTDLNHCNCGLLFMLCLCLKQTCTADQVFMLVLMIFVSNKLSPLIKCGS